MPQERTGALDGSNEQCQVFIAREKVLTLLSCGQHAHRSARRFKGRA
jgi:hypothetical protein